MSRYFFCIECWIEKYVESPNRFALEGEAENHRFVIDSDNPKWFHTIKRIEYTTQRDAIVIYDDMDNWMSIYIVEEIDARKNHKYDTQEKFSDQKTHYRSCDNNRCSDSIPALTSFESARKCPRKSFHKLDIIKPEIDDDPCWPWNYSTKECHFDWFFSFAFPFFIHTTKSIEESSYDDDSEADVSDECEEIIDDIDDNTRYLLSSDISFSEIKTWDTTFTIFSFKYRPSRKRIWSE